MARILLVPKTHGGEACAGLLEAALVLAQLRDVLPAEDSTVVPKENDHGLGSFPEGAQADGVSAGVGQVNRR